MPLQKIQINLEVDLIKQIDAYAHAFHITRTAAMAILLTKALQAEKG